MNKQNEMNKYVMLSRPRKDDSEGDYYFYKEKRETKSS